MCYARAAVFVLALLISCTAASAPKTLSIATGEYPPLTDSQAIDKGFVNATVTKIAREAGYDVSFTFLPWVRALELTRRGRFQATSYFYHQSARDADFIHVGPIVKSELRLFRRADAPEIDWARLEDLSHLRFGAVPGYTYNEEFWRLANEGTLDVELAQNDEANLRKLYAGRIDVFISNKRNGVELIDRLYGKSGENAFTTFEKPLETTFGFLLISRATSGAEAMAKRLQEAVDTLGSAVQL